MTQITSDSSGDAHDIPPADRPSLTKYDPPEVQDHTKRRFSTPWSR